MNSDPAVQRLTLAPGAHLDTIREAERSLGARFPQDYVDFLSRANGGEGPVGDESYVILWPAERLVRRNRGYKVGDAYAPGLVFIGSDGGNEAFAIRESDGWYVCAPFIGMSDDAVEPLGATLAELLANLP